MKVKFFDPGKNYLGIKTEIDNEMQRVLASGDLVLRQDVETFEQNLAKYLDVKFAIGLNSGTDALFLALKAHRVGAGDEVITVSNTFKATITSIIHAGATPVLVDIDSDYLMDLNSVIKALTLKTRAVIPVHLSGDVVNVPLLRTVLDNAGRSDIIIIEDAAQALGGKFDEQLAGSMGDVGCFSFYPAKILGAYGDAGALVTNNPVIANWVRDARNHFKDAQNDLGWNSRLDNLQATILNVKLRYLSGTLASRQFVAERYNDAFAELPITVPTGRGERVWQDYIIRSERRDSLYAFLKDAEIECLIPPILPHQELKLNFPLPKSEQYNAQFLRLPCNPDMTDGEVDYVISKVKEFYANLH